MLTTSHVKFAKIAGLVAAFLSALLVIYALGFAIGQRSGEYGADAQGYTAQYPRDTAKQIDDCFKLPTRADTTKCADEAVKASHENQRSEHDLTAQREAADWAW